MFLGGSGRKATPSLESYAKSVEGILLNLGIDPVAARLNTEAGFGWSFQRGSATIEVYVTQNEGLGYLQVLAPILVLPQNGLLPLYRRLLELNLQITNAAFGVYLDVVYVFSERPLDGLDSVEVNAILTQVANYADELDDKLAGEFGGRLYGKI